MNFYKIGYRVTLGLLVLFLFPVLGTATTFYTVKEALKIVLPQVKEFKEDTRILTEEQKQKIQKLAKIKFNRDYDQEFHWYLGISDGKVAGYAGMDTALTDCNLCADPVSGNPSIIKYMIGFTPEGQVTKIVIIDLNEKDKRLKPIKEQKFLAQFAGKKFYDPLKIKKDILAVTGATKSSAAFTNGVRKMLYIFKELYYE